VGGNEGVRLFLVELTDRARGNRHILKNQEIPFEHKKTCLYCEGGQTVEEVAQKGCGISVFGDTQHPAGHGPGQSALCDPV